MRVTEWEPPGFRDEGPDRPDRSDPRPSGQVVRSDPDSSPRLAPAPTSDPEPVWLVAEPTVERLALDERCWVDVVRGLVPDGDAVHDQLQAAVAWQQGRVFRYERWIDEPRLGSWQAGPTRHPALAEVQDWLSARYRVAFDGVALAQYRNGRDSVAWHRDRELKWLEDTVIGVLSLGSRRPWLMRPMDGRRAEAGDRSGAIDLAPSSGDLLVMGGRSQTSWLHAVPKTPGPSRSRISAQWRWTSRRGQPDLNPSYYAPRHYSS